MNMQSAKAKDIKTVAIVGARGYSGLELIRLLLTPLGAPLLSSLPVKFEVAGFYASKDFDLSRDFLEPEILAVPCYKEDDLHHHTYDIVFLATPVEVSLKWAPRLVAKGTHVIDLSGAFRLKQDSIHQYQKWYNISHSQVDLIQQAIFGLQPWAEKEFAAIAKNQQGSQQQMQKGVLISNPGCYATACLMPLVPLLKHGLLQPESIVLDGKSGTSGAGRKGEERLLFTEVAGDCLPYRIAQHQHTPEIQETVENLTGCKIDPFFSTYLLSLPRGLTVSLYAKIHSDYQKIPDLEQKIEASFKAEFLHYPWVRWQNLSYNSATPLLSLKSVVGTPYTHISYKITGDKIYIYSLIDNLLKGAASQAIENAVSLCHRLFQQPNNKPLAMLNHQETQL